MDYYDLTSKVKNVSRVGLGTWAIGGGNWGETNEELAIATIRKAVDLGITLIDTAPVYGFGQSEVTVGKALAGLDRERIIVATKCGLSWNEDGDVYRDSRSATLEKELETTLKRMNLDYIDLYQIHWPDIKTPLKETADFINRAYDQGLIRAVGVSNFSTEQMEEWMQYARLDTMQPSYNILENKLFFNPIPFAKKHNIRILGYSALSRGMLSGKYTKDTVFHKDDMRAADDPKFQGQDFLNHLDAVEELKTYGKQFNVEVPQLAVRWVLDEGIDTALWGARKPEQLDLISGVFGWSLNDAQRQEMEDLVAKHVPVQVNKDFLEPPYMD